MDELIKKHASKLRFALIGGINTALDFGLLFGLTALGLDKIIANYISTGFALIFSFFANRSYTFKSTTSTKKQIVPFLIVTLIGLWILQPLIIWAYTSVVGDDALSLFVAKLLATVASLTWNYLLYSRFVFKDKESA